MITVQKIAGGWGLLDRISGVIVFRSPYLADVIIERSRWIEVNS